MAEQTPAVLLKALQRMLIKVPIGPPLPFKRVIKGLKGVRKGIDQLIVVLEREEARRRKGKKRR